MRFWNYALAEFKKPGIPGLKWALRNEDTAERFDDIAGDLKRYTGILGDSYTPDDRVETASLVEAEGVSSFLREQPERIDFNEKGRPSPSGTQIQPEDHSPESLHYLALDIDHPTLAIESSTKGHYHLYIKKPITWKQYHKIMIAMGQAGLIEPGYVAASERRGWTCLRTPWTKKAADPFVGEPKKWKPVDEFLPPPTQQRKGFVNSKGEPTTTPAPAMSHETCCPKPKLDDATLKAVEEVATIDRFWAHNHDLDPSCPEVDGRGACVRKAEQELKDAVKPDYWPKTRRFGE